MGAYRNESDFKQLELAGLFELYLGGGLLGSERRLNRRVRPLDSAFPTAPGVNPMVSIMALAHRTAQSMLSA